jgi:hypothetical protein
VLGFCLFLRFFYLGDNCIVFGNFTPVLVVKEAEYPERTTDHGQATGKLYHLRIGDRLV